MRELYIVDLKRIVKDKLFIVTCILAGVFALINPFVYKLLDLVLDKGAGVEGVMTSLLTAKGLLFSSFSTGNNLGVIMPILISVIVCKEFSHGTVRNKIIGGRSRVQIYFSHLFASATVICTMMLLQALLCLCVSLCFFKYQHEPFVAADFGYLMASLAFEMIVYFAIAAIVTFITFTTRKIGICILLYLAVFFVFTIVGAIFSGAALYFEMSDKVHAAEAVRFLADMNFYSSSIIGTDAVYKLRDVICILILPVTLIAGSTLFGNLIFRRKDLK